VSGSEKLNGLIGRVSAMRRASRTVSDFVIDSMCDGSYDDARIKAMERYVDELFDVGEYAGRTNSERVELLRGSIGTALSKLEEEHTAKGEIIAILREAWTEDWDE